MRAENKKNNPDLWPKNMKCAVAFSFDVDFDSSWRIKLRDMHLNENEPLVRSMGKYGVTRGLPRILNLLKKYSIKGTFFVPGIIVDEYTESIARIKNDGHEIALHGYNHITPTTLSDVDQKKEIRLALKSLEENLSVRPVGYRSPGSGIGKGTLEALVENGVIYDSSQMGDDIPYLFEVDDKRKIIEIPWKWDVDDWPFYAFNYYPPLTYKLAPPVNPRVVAELWKDEFDVLYNEGLFFTFIAHPQQSGQPSRIRALEEVVKHIKSKKNVWITTYKEIAKSGQRTYTGLIK